VDDEALATLVSLLRLAQPLAKNQLQRLFLNLCWDAGTRGATLRILLSLLRAPAAAEGAAAAAAAAAAGAGGEPGAAAPRSLADALQARPPAARARRACGSGYRTGGVQSPAYAALWQARGLLLARMVAVSQQEALSVCFCLARSRGVLLARGAHCLLPYMARLYLHRARGRCAVTSGDGAAL